VTRQVNENARSPAVLAPRGGRRDRRQNRARSRVLLPSPAGPALPV